MDRSKLSFLVQMNIKQLLVIFVVFAGAAGAEQPKIPKTQKAQALYLHFLEPTNYVTNPPSAECLLTTRIRLGRHFQSGVTGKSVSGCIESRAGKLVASLSGSYGPSTGGFEGEVELEKPFTPNRGYVFSSMVFLTYFVVSTNSDGKLFLARNPYLAEESVGLRFR
jgi:hypothetical protein